jgi:nucleoside-triphosphatase THEP1
MLAWGTKMAGSEQMVNVFQAIGLDGKNKIFSHVHFGRSQSVGRYGVGVKRGWMFMGFWFRGTVFY